jgi:hypothetical protein
VDRSTKHSDARVAAQRIPALNASLALLVADTTAATLALYGTERPTPGDPPGADAVVTFILDPAAGTVDTDLYQIHLTVPIEAQISNAEAGGTDVLWGRITDGAGDWWGDVSISDEAGSGEIKLQSTTLFNGAFSRITGAIFHG